MPPEDLEPCGEGHGSKGTGAWLCGAGRWLAILGRQVCQLQAPPVCAFSPSCSLPLPPVIHVNVKLQDQ